ncbi:MAG: FG-GAP-like repeat-containing protein, partial [Candidatus Omnitrophota bacterium]
MLRLKIWILSAVAVVTLISVRDKEVVLNVPSGHPLVAEAYHSASSNAAVSTPSSTATTSAVSSSLQSGSSSSGSSSSYSGSDSSSDSSTGSGSGSSASTGSSSSTGATQSTVSSSGSDASTSGASGSVAYYGLASTYETASDDEEEVGATAGNSAPQIGSYIPATLNVSVDEGSSLAFSVAASDADDDAVSYSWKIDGSDASVSDSQLTYSPAVGTAGTHTVNVTVSDGSLAAQCTWTVTVNDVTLPKPVYVTSLLPNSGIKGVDVVIQGAGFSTTAAENIVKFGDVTANSVKVVSANQLIATVPDTATGGLNDVVISVNDSASKKHLFDVLDTSAINVFINNTALLLPSGMTLSDSRIIRLADIDGDKDLDMLIIDVVASKVYLLINNGNGYFSKTDSANLPASITSAASFITDVVFGDVNNDGFADILISYSQGQSVELLLNSGTGTFADFTSTNMPSLFTQTMALDVGDINGDGYLDVIAANYDSGDVLLINDGTGKFSRDAHFSLPEVLDGSSDIKFCDINNDGAVDIVTANNAVIGDSTLSSRIYLNNGSGVFSDATDALMPASGEYCEVLDLGDIDRDGDIDLVVAGYNQNIILINDGAGVFEDKTVELMPTNYFHSKDIKLGDLNGDGYLDLIILGESNASLLLNNKKGSFKNSDSSIKLPDYVSTPAQIGGRNIELADINADGLLDIMIGGATLNVLVSNATNKPPVLDMIGNRSVEAGKTLTINLNAADPNGDVLIYSAENIPSGAVFNSSSHLFSWTPKVTDIGDYENVAFAVTEETAESLSDNEAISISVVSADLPVIDYYMPIDLDVTSKLGEVLQFGLSAHDPKGGELTYTWVFNGEEIPNITVGTSSNIFIFPRLGDNIIEVRVSNSFGTTPLSWNLAVTDTDNEVPDITSYSPVSPTASIDLSTQGLIDFTVSATDPESDTLTYSWAFDGTVVSTASTLANTAYSSLASVGTHTVIAS